LFYRSSVTHQPERSSRYLSSLAKSNTVGHARGHTIATLYKTGNPRDAELTKMVFNSGDGSTALDEHIVRVQTLDKISGGIGFPVLKAMADGTEKTALETQINEHEAYKEKVDETEVAQGQRKAAQSPAFKETVVAVESYTEYSHCSDKVFQKGWPQHYHEWDTVGSDRRELVLYFFRLRNAFLHVSGFANTLRHCRANETLQTANHVPSVPCTNSKSCVASESFFDPTTSLSIGSGLVYCL